MNRLAVLIAVCSLFVAGQALAAFNAPPNQACSYLDGTGIQTRGYKKLEERWGCSSAYFDLGGSPVPNNVVYYVKGTSSKATELKLVLNINDISREQSALQGLVLYSNKLIKQSLKLDMFDELEAAISKGKPASWQKGSVKVDLIRDEWPSGKGYSLKLVVR